MKKFELFAGSAVWITISLLMAAAALEPVDVQARTAHRDAIASACPDGSAHAMGCASIHL